MLLHFVLPGAINKSKRSRTFDLWGILSQYKPPSRGVNSRLVNNQSDRTSLAEVRVRTATWFLGCSSFLLSLQEREWHWWEEKKRWFQKKLTQNEESWESIWDALWKLMVTGNGWLDCPTFSVWKQRYLFAHGLCNTDAFLIHCLCL